MILNYGRCLGEDALASAFSLAKEKFFDNALMLSFLYDF